MKKYEGLFILNIVGKEEGVKELIDKISAEIAADGGLVQTVQKMEKRPFARVANRRHSSGYYVNVIFEIEPGKLAHLKHRFTMNDDVFRVVFTNATAPKAEPAAAA